jgi:hypothetical protein
MNLLTSSQPHHLLLKAYCKLLTRGSNKGKLASGARGVKNKKMKAAVATNVTVDLEGLDCTLCLDPLRLQPPVFQVSFLHTRSSFYLYLIHGGQGVSYFAVRARHAGGGTLKIAVGGEAPTRARVDPFFSIYVKGNRVLILSY